MKSGKVLISLLVLSVIFSSFQIINTGKSPYRVLGIPSYSNWKQIKIQYKHLTIKYHPDKIRSSSASEQELNKKRFMEINEAYENLKKKRSVSEEDEDDNQLSNILMESFFTILVIVIYAKLQEYVLKLLVYIVEKLTGFFVMYLSFYHIFDRYFDHYFDDENNKQVMILVFTSLALFLKYYYYRSNNTTNSAVKDIKEN